MANPSSSETLSLSPLDQTMPLTYTRLLLCFPFNGENTAILTGLLQSGVDHIVYQMPFLAGTLHPNDVRDEKSGRAEVIYPSQDAKVSLRVMRLFEFRYSYSELHDAGMPMNRLDNSLTPVSVFADPAKEPCPVFAIQATFIKGGLFLCICVHHAVMDGTGFGTFVGMLAESCASGGRSEIANLQQIQDRSLCFQGLPANHPHNPHPEYKIVDPSTPPPLTSATPSLPPMTVRLFHFSASSLSTLKSSLTAHLPPPVSASEPPSFISTNDALTALLWSCVTRARSPHLDTSTSSRLGMAVNARRHLNPPLSPNYLGNVNLFATSLLPLSTLSAPDPASLASVALSIRKAIVAVNNQHIRSAVSLIDSLPNIKALQYGFNSFLGPDIAVTSWEGMGVYGQNWGLGLGTPGWARTVTSGSGFDGLGIVMPRRPGGGLEVMLGLRSEDMERLERDAIWREYCGGFYE
jgi:hypothetical protein